MFYISILPTYPIFRHSDFVVSIVRKNIIENWTILQITGTQTKVMRIIKFSRVVRLWTEYRNNQLEFVAGGDSSEAKLNRRGKERCPETGRGPTFAILLPFTKEEKKIPRTAVAVNIWEAKNKISCIFVLHYSFYYIYFDFLHIFLKEINFISVISLLIQY